MAALSCGRPCLRPRPEPGLLPGSAGTPGCPLGCPSRTPGPGSALRRRAGTRHPPGQGSPRMLDGAAPRVDTLTAARGHRVRVQHPPPRPVLSTAAVTPSSTAAFPRSEVCLPFSLGPDMHKRHSRHLASLLTAPPEHPQRVVVGCPALAPALSCSRFWSSPPVTVWHVRTRVLLCTHPRVMPPLRWVWAGLRSQTLPWE